MERACQTSSRRWSGRFEEQLDFRAEQQDASIMTQAMRAPAIIRANHTPSHDNYLSRAKGTAGMSRSLPIELAHHADVDSAVDSANFNTDADEFVDGLSEIDEEELPPLEYARYHGLTADYLYEPLFQTVDRLPSPAMLFADLQDPDSAFHISSLLDQPALDAVNAPEKWDVDRETAAFLASVLAFGKDDHILDLTAIDRPVRFSDLKIDESVLSTDPELDIRDLRRRNTATVSSQGMEPFPLKAQEGESFAWSREELRAAEKMNKVIANEKLDIDRETAGLLKEIISLGSAPDQDAVEHLDLRDLRALSPVSPPLMPFSPPLSPGEPCPRALEMALTSTPEDLIASEAASVDRKILRQDVAPSFLPHDAETSNSSPCTDLGTTCIPQPTPEESSPSPVRFRSMHDLKADVPLIPQHTQSSPTKRVKSVSFPAELFTMIPNADSDTSQEDVEKDTEAFIAEIVEPMAVLANRQAEREQLVDFDTILRVKAPNVEDVELTAPWTVNGNDEHRNHPRDVLLSNVKCGLSKSETKWSGVSKIERFLPWSPFPSHLGKVELDETFDDGSLAKYLAEIAFENETDVESLLYTPEHLRVLDDADSDSEGIECLNADEEDEPQEILTPDRIYPSHAPPIYAKSTSPAKFAPPTLQPSQMDLQTLLRKRKLELEGASDAGKPSKRLSLGATDINGDDNSVTKNTGRGELATLGGLSGFMQLHGGSSLVARTTERQQLLPPQQLAIPTQMAKPREHCGEQHIPVPPLPAPRIKDAGKARSVILSSEVSLDRSLIRCIVGALPALDIIERDAIVSRSTNVHPTSKPVNRYEADITISASTGLILTTLQKLKQKPLPDQTNFFGVRERIHNVAARYERLIILISEARPELEDDSDPASPLDEHDTEALSDMSGFGALLNTDTQVFYVAGGEQELARWIAAIIGSHTSKETDVKLLHEETLWERFLRHAGLNAYAAQVILSQLKPSQSCQTERSSSTMDSITAPPYGLSSFVQMPAEQRLQQFARLMGGTRVLQRVNGVIDGGWVSASTMKP